MNELGPGQEDRCISFCEAKLVLASGLGMQVYLLVHVKKSAKAFFLQRPIGA